MEIRSIQDKALLLKISDTSILVECPISMSSLLKSTPISIDSHHEPIVYEHAWISDLDISLIDLVLISNITTIHALPYLNTKFNGKILMTEPVSTLGASICQELLEFDEEYMRTMAGTSNLYSSEDIKGIWKKVIPLSYNQIYQLRELKIAAVSSGHSLGGANWILELGNLTIGIISQSCLDASRYPAAFNQSIFNSNIIIFTPQNTPSTEPFSAKALYNTFIETCRSLAFQSSIVVPIESWQLLDLESHVLSAGTLFDIPTLCMAPSANAFFSYASGCTEWLSHDLRMKAYIPQNCFMFEAAKEKGHLAVFHNLKDGFGAKLKSRCILLLSHSSLRLGEADYVISHLSRKGFNNVMVLVDGQYRDSALPPFQNAGILQNFDIKSCYLNVGLVLGEIETCLENTKADTILIPKSFEGLLNIRKLKYYEDAQVCTVNASPTLFKIHANCPGEVCPVVGTLDLKNYKYVASLQDRIRLIREKLYNRGLESSVKFYQTKCVLYAPDGEIIFKGKRIIVKANTNELRKSLYALLNN
ncbi:unnamed protein product [Blepharisma stoltei]|uniref:Metallo-beta-lactamase domain-containing protein n=1 Tax=Blepharisma stoltei TaxID=1481888 RepID=A0AAU9J8F9_9CILI|nr:unnamed protein product [Blepharisma stoltei]